MDAMNQLQKALPDALAANVVCNLHIEVQQKLTSMANIPTVKQYITKFLHGVGHCFSDFKMNEFTEPFLQEHIVCVSLSDVSTENQGTEEDGPAQEEMDDESMAAANHWLLPSADFQGMWESLIFDGDIKSQLLQYARTTMLFSDKNIDSNIISWNRVILLHGPPGTGKTSLCKALSQKLTILLSDRYSYGQLIEINSHSLFSKWFSESGKLVMKMFAKIQELIEDSESLVCVLIDEVESLTAARKASMQGNEPSDAIRVVNALLTQLDQIRKNDNVIILTTSNITGAIDLAFVDRADIKQYIGPPSSSAIYSIYLSCIQELMRAGILHSETIISLKQLQLMTFTENDATRLALKLQQISQKSEGLSGRTLRKLPFLAHALYIQDTPCNLATFLDALFSAVEKQFAETESLCKS